MQSYCVADEDTVRGFQLAGVPGQAVSTLRETSDAIAAAYERAGCGLLIVTEEVVARLGPVLASLRLERSRPLVVEIPGPGRSTAGPGRESLGRLVRRMTGTSLEDDW